MDFLRKFMVRMNVAPSDEEIAKRQSIFALPSGQRPSASQSVPEAGLYAVPPSAKLIEFRTLVGITSDSSFRAPRGFDANRRPVVTISGRPAPNIGIYMTVVDKEVKSKKRYKFFSVLINTCLGLQIIVAASLTALGASLSDKHSHHSGSITALGALNTVIAGFLTYLKGSGLPNRLKFFQHEWDKVREYIEARERDLICDDDAFDIYEQVGIIRTMYEEVKADVESNTPDRFVSAASLRQPADSSTRRPGLGDSDHKRSDVASENDDKLSRMASSISGALGGTRKTGGADIEKSGYLEKEVSSHESNAVSKGHDFGVHFLSETMGLKNRVADKMKDISDLEKQIESHGRTILKVKQQEATAKASEAETISRELEAQTTSAAADKEAELKSRFEEIARIQRELEYKTVQAQSMSASLRQASEEVLASQGHLGGHGESVGPKD